MFPIQESCPHSLLFCLWHITLDKKSLPLESENYFLKPGFCPCPPKCNINRIKEVEEGVRQLFIRHRSCCSVQILCNQELFGLFLQRKHFALLLQRRIHREEWVSRWPKAPHLMSGRIGSLTLDYLIPQPCLYHNVPVWNIKKCSHRNEKKSGLFKPKYSHSERK